MDILLSKMYNIQLRYSFIDKNDVYMLTNWTLFKEKNDEK